MGHTAGAAVAAVRGDTLGLIDKAQLNKEPTSGLAHLENPLTKTSAV